MMSTVLGRKLLSKSSNVMITNLWHAWFRGNNTDNSQFPTKTCACYTNMLARDFKEPGYRFRFSDI